MANTRMLYHTVEDGNGQPRADYTIHFQLTPAAYKAHASLPESVVTVTTNSAGYFETPLETGVEYKVLMYDSFVQQGTTIKYGNRNILTIVVPHGTEPIDLPTVIALETEPDPDPDLGDIAQNHIGRRDNPHEVTAAQAGTYTSGEIDNALALKLDASAVPTELTDLDTSVTGTELDALKQAADQHGDIVTHDASEFATAAQGGKADTALQPDALNDYETTAQLNSRDAANRDRANHTGTQAISTVSGLQDALDSKVPTTRTVNGHALSSNVTLDKGDVGLGNVDNTSDASKPISTATQNALNLKANDADVVKTATAQTITGRKTFAPANSEPIIAANSAPALSGWTLTGTATYSAPNIVITAGAASISYSATVVAGRAYQFDVTSTGDAGEYTISVGSVSVTLPASVKSFALIASGSGSQTIKLEGTTWAATISALTVREVQLAAPAIIANTGEIRAYSSNTAAGQNALSNNTTGGNNTATGQNALQSNTTGGSNTAAGYYALRNNTTGRNNTAAGRSALTNNTTGSNNTAAGYLALTSNTTGSNNTAAGHAVLYNNTTGGNNTAAGYAALYSNTTGSYNTAAGRNALINNTTGSNNTAAGYNSGPVGDAVDRSTSLGYQAQANHDRSVALGADTDTTAADQVMVGNRDIEITSATRGVILRSPNGTRYRLTVADGGALTAVAV